MTLALLEPSAALLPGYAAALARGWSPNTTRDVSGEQLAAIGRDPDAFLADLVRTEGGTVTLADGQEVPRIPSRVRWMWDDGAEPGFCGAINFRYLPGTIELPPHVSGHIGYAVVPWAQRRGYATQALRLMLDVVRGFGLPRVLVTCGVDNAASRRVIEANGGVAAGIAPPVDGSPEDRRLFWIELGGGHPR